MFGLLLYETLELTYYATKVIMNCASRAYYYFYPTPNLLMIEMQEMKERISELEKLVQEQNL